MSFNFKIRDSLFVRSTNGSTTAEEYEHIATGAENNNLKLNQAKTSEMTFSI